MIRHVRAQLSNWKVYIIILIHTQLNNKHLLTSLVFYIQMCFFLFRHAIILYLNYLPKNCSRSFAMAKFVFIFSCSLCALSHTSPRPPQHCTAIPNSSSVIPLRYKSMANSFWPGMNEKNTNSTQGVYQFLNNILGFSNNNNQKCVFARLNHNLLKRNLEYYGKRGVLLQLTNSYL